MGANGAPPQSPRLPRSGYLGYKHSNIGNPNGVAAKELLRHATIVIFRLSASGLLHERTSTVSAQQIAVSCENSSRPRLAFQTAVPETSRPSRRSIIDVTVGREFD